MSVYSGRVSSGPERRIIDNLSDIHIPSCRDEIDGITNAIESTEAATDLNSELARDCMCYLVYSVYALAIAVMCGVIVLALR